MTLGIFRTKHKRGFNMCEITTKQRRQKAMICSPCERCGNRSDLRPQRMCRQSDDCLKALAYGEGVRRFSGRGSPGVKLAGEQPD
jgi:hypothetical protein